jgi:hypothetical protein
MSPGGSGPIKVLLMFEDSVHPLLRMDFKPIDCNFPNQMEWAAKNPRKIFS